ncbi:MAG: tRNA preQ1(34) S-adenosylmethionine ribosyltransferase-isomerase QueA [Bacteroidales bacterium]|nr:tRNA preQ1(34) S-adenosylmethionine ribosyltransferase-isomerase QueA [Bacteroidales bacterium]
MDTKLSFFNFTYPRELVAEKPSKQRDECRMLVVHRDSGEFEHRIFKDFIEFVNPGDVVLANNTKVFPALLYGEKEKTGARITVFLQRELNRDMRLWDVVVDPARKIRIGNKLYFGPNESLVAEVVDNTTSRGRTVRFLFDGTHEEFVKHIRSLGHTPLPDEIQALRNIENIDAERYQTLFAKVEGAVAAPVAGLHFSRELMKRLEIKDVIWQELTLHCGIGNFKEIEVEDLSKHRMDAEEMHISQSVCDTIMKAKADGKKLCVVGTTTMRALESAVTIPGKISAYDGWTNRFIFPPYHFSLPDMMVTNFHHPRSSHFIMASTFGGPELIMKAYELAIREKYKFSTYGDAMLIV